MASPTRRKEKPEAARATFHSITRPDLTDLGRTLMNGYPGPIVLLDSSGQAFPVNQSATTLAAALNGPLRPQAIPLIARAAEAGAAQSDLLRLGGDKASVAISLTIIPMGPVGSEGLTYLALGRDATLDRNLRDALVESRRRYKDLVECSSDFVWETDAQGNFAFVTARGALGYAPDRLIGKPARSLLDRRRPMADPFPFDAREPTEDVEVWLRDAKGESACLIASSLPMLSPEGEWQGARGICRDVTEAHRRDEALATVRAREQLLAAMVKTIRDEVEPDRLLEAAGEALRSSLHAAACWIYRPGPDDRLARVGTYGETAVPLDEVDERVRRAIEEDLDPDFPGDISSLALPTRYRGKLNGAVSVARIDRRRWSDDERILLAGIADQLGIAFEQIDTHARLLALARTDALTGVLNRRAIVEEIGARLEGQAKGGGRGGVLLYVDLDNFKAVNDRRGHTRGDAALCAVAALLRRHVGTRGVVGRLGGDEFAVWIEDIAPDAVEAEAQALQARSAELARHAASDKLPLSFSIGAVHVPGGTRMSVEALLARADDAMYDIKRGSKSGYSIARSAGTEAPGPAP
ncbi:MAG: diguanylate cyclase [Alphaproteobacteria bacterium]